MNLPSTIKELWATPFLSRFFALAETVEKRRSCVFMSVGSKFWSHLNGAANADAARAELGRFALSSRISPTYSWAVFPGEDEDLPESYKEWTKFSVRLSCKRLCRLLDYMEEAKSLRHREDCPSAVSGKCFQICLDDGTPVIRTSLGFNFLEAKDIAAEAKLIVVVSEFPGGRFVKIEPRCEGNYHVPTATGYVVISGKGTAEEVSRWICRECGESGIYTTDGRGDDDRDFFTGGTRTHFGGFVDC